MGSLHENVFGKGRKTRTKVRAKSSKARKALGGDLPTLADMKKKVPKDGLLDPSLRKGYGKAGSKNYKNLGL